MNIDAVKTIIAMAMHDLGGGVEPGNDFYDELILPMSMHIVVNRAKEILGDKMQDYIVFPHRNDPLYNIALKYSVVLFDEDKFINDRNSSYEFIFNSMHARRYIEQSQNICILRNMGETPEEDGIYKYSRYTIASKQWHSRNDAVIDFISFRNMNKMCYNIITPYTDVHYMYNSDCCLSTALFYLSQNPSSEFEYNRAKECMIFLREFMSKHEHEYYDEGENFEGMIDHYKNYQFTEISPIIMRIMREIYKDEAEDIKL